MHDSTLDPAVIGEPSHQAYPGEETGDHAILGRLRAIAANQDLLERSTINLIASDNARPRDRRPLYRSTLVQEGLSGARPFAGAVHHDELEDLTAELARSVFGSDHANCQPHSCSQANQAVFHALMDPGDNALSLSFGAGGHLTHGLGANFSGRWYRFEHVGVGADERIDYDRMRDMARRSRPRLLVVGASAYPRLYDVERLAEIAAEVGAKLHLDLSHEGGLIAGGALPNVVPLADVVTMSTDKTMRGPFAAVILCRSEIARKVDRAVHPGTQSSFPVQRLGQICEALVDTQTSSFHRYAHRAIENAQAMARVLVKSGMRLVSGGTDKHYVVCDTMDFSGMTGAACEERLERAGLLSSRQSLPTDQSARSSEASGLRLGAAWMASRGYSTLDAEKVASIVAALLATAELSSQAAAEAGADVSRLINMKRADDVWAGSPGDQL